MKKDVYYDYATKNKSFLEMHKYLKNIGVKNNKFILAIHNTDLINVDPYDPNLTPIQKIDIIKECMQNIWYYLREVVRVPVAGGGSVSFELDVNHMAQTYCFIRNINSWIEKPRQLHKTIGSLVLVNHTRIFQGFADEDDFQRILLLGRKRADNRDNKNKLKALTGCLPKYIQQFDYDKYRCVDVEVPTGRLKEKQFCQDLARKMMYTMVFASDAEFIDNIDELYKLSQPAFRATQSVSISKGISSSMMFDSVIRDDVPKIEEFIDGMCEWKSVYYDMDIEVINKILEYHDIQCMYIYNTYEECGKDQSWFDSMCKTLQNNFEVIRREILLKRKNK